ncbi:unnamed protein product, partial [Closterium sp. NIES-65]
VDESAAGLKFAQGAVVAGVPKVAAGGAEELKKSSCPLSSSSLHPPPCSPCPCLPLNAQTRVDESTAGPKFAQGAAVAGVPKVAAGGARGAQEERAAAVPAAGRTATHALLLRRTCRGVPHGRFGRRWYR